jgi:hypothetical protein
LLKASPSTGMTHQSLYSWHNKEKLVTHTENVPIVREESSPSLKVDAAPNRVPDAIRLSTCVLCKAPFVVKTTVIAVVGPCPCLPAQHNVQRSSLVAESDAVDAVEMLLGISIMADNNAWLTKDDPIAHQPSSPLFQSLLRSSRRIFRRFCLLLGESWHDQLLWYRRLQPCEFLALSSNVLVRNMK